MKMLTVIAAALVAATGVAAAPAAAAPVATAPAAVEPIAQDRVIVRERTVVRHRNYRRAPRRVCTVRYRYGRRIRTCRTVYRRY